MQKLFQKFHNRVLPFFLAVLMLASTLPLNVLSTGRGAATEGTANGTPSPDGYIYDYDTLKITRDGKETYAMDLLSYEKITISADGVEEKATYQWQILHNEKEDTWINIYDGTSQELPVSLALVGNLLQKDGTAMLRCRAYTEDYAYLTSPITVTVKEPAETKITLPTQNVKNPSFNAEGELSEFVTVRIEYVQYDFARDVNGDLILGSDGKPILDDGKQAFSPYIATIHRGTELHAVVPNPTIVGYDSFLGDATVVSTSVSISEDSVTDDIVYIVKYKPSLVDYTVRYYFQNIYDDLYVEDPSKKVSTQGYTGSTPPDSILKIEFEGFTSLYYQPDSIAADGSTVFEVYYERNYYLMEFDCNGGYGAETIYVRYGSYVSVPQPVKMGFVFAGWDFVKSENPGAPFAGGDGNADALPNALPPYNTGYKAIWKTAETSYNVVYWIRNDDNSLTYIGNKAVESVSSAIVSGSNDLTVNTNICGLPAHTHTSCTYDCGKTVHTHGDGSCNYICGGHTTHGDGSCVYDNCEHTHDRDCYDFTADVSMETSNSPGSYYSTVKDLRVFRLNFGVNYFYYVEIGTSYYRITGNYNQTTFSYTVDCEHTHDNSCCSLQIHTHTSACCSLDEHTHEDSCCSYVAHTHTNACKESTAFLMEFLEADQNVTVEGDGSTVVNVYYKYRTYMIRFVYARKVGNQLQVATSTSDGQIKNCSWGNVNSLPTVNDPSGATDRTTFTYEGNTYYYISLTAQYGADISDIWPSASIGSTGNYYWGSWGAEYGSGYRNKYGNAHANIVGPYPTMSEDMMVANPQKLDDGTYLAQTMIAWWGASQDNISEHAYHSYFEVLPGEKRDPAKTYIERDGKTYVLETKVFTAAHNGSTRVDPVIYAGYTLQNEDKDKQSNSKNYANNPECPNGDRCDYCGVFYYDRNEHKLNFVNFNSSSVAPSPQTLLFGEPLLEYKPLENPAYPNGLEPGAYYFDGWYTTPECFDDTEVKWNTMVMPDADVTLYAKWTPVLRDVKFYMDYSDIISDASPYMEAKNVKHGSLLGTTYADPPQKIVDGVEYDFIGWFYMDEDNKKRFAPDSMEVTRDLILFAEWQTRIDTTYEINFALKEDVSKENTPSNTAYKAGDLIAETVFAHSSVGKTKTFSAKGLGELNPDFRKKFFPTVNTHSILMEPDGNLNTYTFEYVYDDTVYYKIRYVDYASRTELQTSVVKQTDEAVITEKFLPISGYIPQSFYIRKALAYDGDATENSVIEDNIITFYYIKDTDHGLFSVEYYLENANSTDSTKIENYSQYESIVGNKDILQVHVADIRTYEGYTYEPTLNTVITYKEDGTVKETLKGAAAGDPPRGVVDFTGLTIKIYYKRNLYPYIIEYREYGASASTPAISVIADGSNAYMAKFDTSKSHTAPEKLSIVSGSGTTIYEYHVVGADDEARTKSMTIRAVNDGEANPNKLVYYYTKKKVEVFYEAVCTVPGLTAFGAVSIFSESAATADGLSGSNAMPATGFRLVGWYADKACTIPVDKSWRFDGEISSDKIQSDTGTKLIPRSLDTSKDEIHYYALFEPIYGALKIEKKIDGTGATGATFLFRVQGTDTNNKHIDIIVSIQDDTNNPESVLLNNVPIGKYTVTELTDWSWEFTANTEELTVTVEKDKTAEVSFTNTPNPSDWLSGETVNENQFTVTPTP